MEIPKGEWTYIKGPSGCGKTTLLRILMGLEKADSGKIIWDASEQTHNSQSRWRVSSARSEGAISAENERPNITAVFQEDRLCMNESAIRNVSMVLHNHSLHSLTGYNQKINGRRADVREQIVSHFSRVGLIDREVLNQPVNRLSGGMRRRVAIVRAVMAQGDILLLDEPFQGLDEGTKKQVIQYLKEEQNGRTMVLVTHEGEDADIIGRQCRNN